MLTRRRPPAGEAVFATKGRTITDADIIGFAGFSGDFGVYHLDRVEAAKGLYGVPIMHGAGTFGIGTGLLVQSGFFEGADAVAFLGVTLEWRHRVIAGDTIHVEVTAVDERGSESRPGLVVATISFEVLNQDGQPVLIGEWRSLQRGSLHTVPGPSR